MCADSDPVTSDEYVYRRVLHRWHYPCAQFPNYRVDRQALRPTEDDLDGISVYRALFVEAIDVARDTDGMLGRYCVARMAVSAINDLGMTVLANPMDGLPGHATIPEIRHGLKADEKNYSKERQLKLAELASEDIVYSPESCPH